MTAIDTDPRCTETVIDTTVDRTSIADLSRMTPEARELVCFVSQIRSSGFSELHGCDDSGKLVWAAGAWFDEDSHTWHLTSLGNGAMVQLFTDDELEDTRTDDELDALELFRCATCRKVVSWDKGGEGDDCDDCAHPVQS